MNCISIVGRVGQDPKEYGEVVKFSVAVKGRKDTVTWFNVVCFGKTGEIATKYVTKGREIALTGRMESRKYEDKEGQPRESWDLIVNDLTLIGGVKDDTPASKVKANVAPTEDDYDPFED